MGKKISSFLVLMIAALLSFPVQAQVQKQLLNRDKMQVTQKFGTSKEVKTNATTMAKQAYRSTQVKPQGNKTFNRTLSVKDFAFNRQMAFAGAPMKIQQDSHGIITSPDEGEHKYYNRSGNAYYLSNGSLYGTTQSGIVEIVETEDGTVYIKDIISRYTQGTWVKGTKEGNTITVASGQPLAFNTNYYTTLSLFNIFEDEEGYVEKTSDNITFTIDGEVITLDNDLIGIFWDDDDSWTGYGDYETVWTLNNDYVAPSTELVELPAGATVENWYAVGKAEEGKVPLNAKVAFVGNDVYVSGIFSDFPESWIKGTIDGNTISFATLQYLGAYNGTMPIWLYITDTYGTAMPEATFTYDANAKKMTLDEEQIMWANAASDRIYYLNGIESLTISAEAPEVPELVTLPAGVQPEEYTLDLYGYYSYGAIGSKSTKMVAFDGDDVYVQGLAYYFPDAYVKGTLNADGQYVFKSGQFVGEDSYGEEYLVGLDVDFEGYLLYAPEFVFDFDANSRVLTLASYYGESEVKDEANIYDYFEVATYTPGAYIKPGTTQVPEDLVTDTYQMTAHDTYYDENVIREVLVGFYGDNEVYFRGLSEYTNGWAKGTIDANGIVSIPETFLGTLESIFGDFDIYLPEVQFVYNAAESKFVCEEGYATASDDGSLWDELENVVLTKLNEIEATPADPSVAEFVLYKEPAQGSTELEFTTYPYVGFDIPAMDVDGNQLIMDKLSYIIYIIDAQGEQQPLTLTADLYELFDTDMTEIPYAFSDGWDIDQYGSLVYLNQNPEEIASWKKIGVQSIYRGAGVEHRSNIGWFDIEAYTAGLKDATSGINSVEVNNDNARYFDVQGRVTNENAKGLLIKQVRMTDGTTKTVKIVRK